MKICYINKLLFSMFINFPLYLIGLIPLALIIGPLISELILIILSFSFLYSTIKNKNFYYFKNNFFFFFIIFCLYISIISLFAENSLISLKQSFFYFRFGIYALAIYYFIERNKNAINICIWKGYILLFVPILIFRSITIV